MAYNEALEAMAEETAAAALALYTRMIDGTLTREQFDVMLDALVGRTALTAELMAGLSMAAWEYGRDGSTVLAAPAEDTSRVHSDAAAGALAAATMGAPSLTGGYAVERAARDYAAARGQEEFSRQLIGSTAAGWKRQPNATACPLCRDWADGRVWGRGIRMPRHNGCTCSQLPV